MAYRIDPSVRLFSIDTGRLPTETFELIETLRERYPGLALTLLSPDAPQLQRLVDRHGPNLFYRSIEQRLLCCNVRKVQPLTRYLAGVDAWVTGLRRDQWAGRTDIRKVEIDHDHGAIVKLNPLAEWTEDEVWDYVRENDVPVHPLYAQGYTSIGCAPCTRRVAGANPSAPDAGGGNRARPRSAGCTARSKPAASSTSCTRSSARRIIEQRRREDGGARGRSRRGAGGAGGGARRGVPRPSRRGRRCRRSRVRWPPRRRQISSVLLELGLQAGRIRAIYGAGGEQAALRLFRRLPGGAELTESARSVSEALATLNGRPLDSFPMKRSAPACTGSPSSPAAQRLPSGSTGAVQLASIGV